MLDACEVSSSPMSDDVSSEPSLETLTPELYSRLSRLERWWARWSYRTRLAHGDHGAPDRLRLSIERAYTQAALLWLLLAVPFGLAGALVLGVATGSMTVNVVAASCFATFAAFIAVVAVRINAVTKFLRELETPDPPPH